MSCQNIIPCFLTFVVVINPYSVFLNFQFLNILVCKNCGVFLVDILLALCRVSVDCNPAADLNFLHNSACAKLMCLSVSISLAIRC